MPIFNIYGHTPAEFGAEIEDDYVNVDTGCYVNEYGYGDSLGQYSRYSNMELPIYHLGGWWDIFINGQIDTYNFLMNNFVQQ